MTRDSMTDWRRVAIMIVALGIAAVAARSAAIGVSAGRAPARALTIDPNNPVALMKRVDSELAIGGVNQAPKTNWRADALTALRAQPLSPAAVRTLGLVAASDGRAADARSLVVLAERLSRRGGLAQLWLVQDSARRDDARAALAHIDIALSVNGSLAPIVFPVLLQVLPDRRYALEFAQLVKRDRPWLGSFLTFANTDNPAPEALADVVSIAGGLPRGAAFRVHETNILWSLANAGNLGRAANLLLELRRATPALLADGRFSDATVDAGLGPFAWSGSVDPEISSSIERDATVRILIAPGKSGMVLQRYLALPVGAYRISASVRPDAEDMKASIEVDIRCTTSANDILYRTVTNIAPIANALGGTFDVPARCPMQWVRFTAQGGDVQTDGALTLSGIGLTKSTRGTDRQRPPTQIRTETTQ